MSEARITNLLNEINTGGPTISGITTFSGTNYFVPPVGNTQERPDNPEKGSIRFNTDSRNLEYFRGDAIGWVQLEGFYNGNGVPDSGGYMGLLAGGNDPSPWTGLNTIDFVTISTMGDSQDFGDLHVGKTGKDTCCNEIRCLWPGGYTGGGYQDAISYNNIQSKGNGSDFGDLTVTKTSASACNDKVRGLIGSAQNQGSAPYYVNTIEYVTIATAGNAIDFGDNTAAKNSHSNMASSTRGFWGDVNMTPTKISYSLFRTTGNATSFGDIGPRPFGGTSNAVRGLWFGNYGGNNISYITLASTGDALDFGDLTSNKDSPRSMSSGTRAVTACGRNTSNQQPYQSMESVQIMTLGNAVEFGDIAYMTNTTDFSYSIFSGSNGHGGLSG